MLFRKTILWLILVIVLLGCQTSGQNGRNNGASGRIILWHSWSKEETAVLESMLAEFQEIHPDIVVIDIQYAENELLPSFQTAGSQGTGPDLLIGSDRWIQALAGSGLIRPYTSPGNTINPLAREAVTYQDQTYGLPLTMHPFALYYNQALVDSVPATLDDLLVEAAQGNQVAFVPRFDEAYWGIQAFGQDLFDQNGQLDLANSGLIPWLEWLSEAQNDPGVILNVDDASLRQLFVQGDVAYYVAGPQAQAALQMEMEDPFGVTVLPAGPEGPSGPLLPLETFLFYDYSSQNQAQLSQLLAEFLTNQQQSIRLMRELSKAPANPQVSVDPRLYPTVSGFIRQSRTANVIPNDLNENAIDTAGDRLYAAALSGDVTAIEAVCSFGQTLAEAEEWQESQVLLPDGCSFLQSEGE